MKFNDFVDLLHMYIQSYRMTVTRSMRMLQTAMYVDWQIYVRTELTV